MCQNDGSNFTWNMLFFDIVQLVYNVANKAPLSHNKLVTDWSHRYILHNKIQ